MKQHIPLLFAALLASGAAQAELQGRDLNGSIDSFEAYYDTDLNITWLADANYAKTSGYDADGRMKSGAAAGWAASLSFTDGVNVYDHWRLPTTLQPDASCDGRSFLLPDGFNCTGSEMGHLFYSELGGPIGVGTDPDVAKFTNLQADFYWSGTPYASATWLLWRFNMGDGYQYAFDDPAVYALAVSDGDVGIAAVPEPETYAMMLAGLGLVGFMASRRKNS